MKAWYCIRHLNPVRVILSKFQLCISDAKALYNCSFKLNFPKYYLYHLSLGKPTDKGFPVLPKAQVYSSLAADAYVGLGASRGQKGGFIYPEFYENFMGLYQLNSHYFKEYTVQGNGYFSSRMVQGCIHAETTNRRF